MNTIDAVRRYYDQNTALFLRFGSAQEAQSIHRALWHTQGISLAKALQRSNELVLKQLCEFQCATTPKVTHLLDLGCGTGGTLIFLLHRSDPNTSGSGVTLSTMQARIGQNNVAQQNLAKRCAIHAASYLSLPFTQSFNFVYSIEAFIHSPDASAFFVEAARVATPISRLVVIDDFMSHPARGAHDPILRAYRDGWHANSFLPVQAVQTHAETSGWRLTQNIDLTPQLKLRVLPTSAAQIAYFIGARLGRLHSVLESMAGSIALQQGLAKQLIEYRMLVFDRYTA